MFFPSCIRGANFQFLFLHDQSMKRRSFVKFLSLLPALNFLKSSKALASTAGTSVRKRPPNPTYVEALKFETPRRTELVVIASRPSVGKTAFMMNLLDQYAFDRNERSMFFTIEMSREKLSERWSEMSAAGGAIPSWARENVKIDDSNRLTAQDVRRKVEKTLLTSPGLRYVFVDYLQLLGYEGLVRNRTDQVDEILQNLKKMAVELNLAVILSAQLSRGIGENGAAPSPKYLREVSDLSQIDRLALLHMDYRTDTLKVSIQRPTQILNTKSFEEIVREARAAPVDFPKLRKEVDEQWPNLVTILAKLNAHGSGPASTWSKEEYHKSLLVVTKHFDQLYSEMIAGTELENSFGEQSLALA